MRSISLRMSQGGKLAFCASGAAGLGGSARGLRLTLGVRYPTSEPQRARAGLAGPAGLSEDERETMELTKAAAAPSPIKDTTEATFMADVIEASQEVPVIVDFWAPWCGPCKTLTPALEKAVTEAKGKVRLVKIDVDQNQRIAAQMRVQSIPSVFGFVGGQPVDGFMGAQPAGEIKAFVDRLIEMSGGNAGLRGSHRHGRGDAGRSGGGHGADLRCDTGRGPGQRGRARRAGAGAPGAGRGGSGEGDPGAGAQGQEDDAAILAARAQIELAEASAGAGETAELAAAVERNPDDHQARYDLAMALVAKGDGAGAMTCWSSSGATGSETAARRRRSSSSSSTASGRRARRRRRGGGA